MNQKIGTITINTFLPMRNKFLYSCSIKIHASGFNQLLESIFCLLLVVEAFFPAKSCQDGWREVGWIWQMRQNFIAQYIQLLKCWLCVLWSGIAMEKNWALSVDQRWLQVLQFSVHLINLLSMLLILWFRQDSESCSRSFGQQTTRQWPWPFFGASLVLGSALELLLSPSTELVVSGCCIQSTFCCVSQSNQEIVHCCWIKADDT